MLPNIYRAINWGLATFRPLPRVNYASGTASVNMRFTLLDKITELEAGQRITAIKNLSLAEEYLADHFPGFPVMPGVFMLEAMTQAGAWLIRATDDFAQSVVVLKEARNVKYASFVEPGQQMVVTAEMMSQEGRLVKLKAQGAVGTTQTVSARLVLERYNLADADPSKGVTDEVVRYKLRELFALLYRGAVVSTHGAAQS